MPFRTWDRRLEAGSDSGIETMKFTNYLPRRPIALPQRLSEGFIPLVVGVLTILTGRFFITMSRPEWTYATWAGWCFVAMGLVSAAIGVAGCTVRSFPTLQSVTRGGQPAVGIRSWWGSWAFSWAADALLALLGVGAFIIDLMTGARNLVVTAPAALVGAWLAMRLALYVRGAKRMEAVWLTEDSLVHEQRAGVEVAPFATITSVEPTFGFIAINTSAPPQRRLCPRLWRATSAEKKILIATGTMGHPQQDLAAWIREGVGVRG